MQPFTSIDGIAAPLPLENVDTDKILPAAFLRTVSREGLGGALFWPLRQTPDFALNHAPWNRAEILVALDNFGCGSSREHAPWALLDFGIRCVIAPRIADIFSNNCCKNGILPITLDRAIVEHLIGLCTDPEQARMRVDLVQQCVETADGRSYRFEIDAGRKADLLAGTDEIARAMAQENEIAQFERGQRARAAWIADTRIDATIF